MTKKNEAVPRELSAEEKKRRAYQIQALREKGVPLDAPVLPMPSDAVSTVVANPENPYLSLWREFQAGQLTLEALHEAIDLDVCGDPKKLMCYEALRMPTKPQELEDAETILAGKVDHSELKEAIGRLQHKMAMENKRVSAYLYSVDKIKSENSGNLWFLKDMFSRQSSKNPVAAARIREAIYTHEAA